MTVFTESGGHVLISGSSGLPFDISQLLSANGQELLLTGVGEPLILVWCCWVDAVPGHFLSLQSSVIASPQSQGTPQQSERDKSCCAYKNKCFSSMKKYFLCSHGPPELSQQLWRARSNEGREAPAASGHGGSQFWAHLFFSSQLKFGFFCHLVYTWRTMLLSLSVLPVGCVWSSRAGNGMENLQSWYW